MVVGTVTNTLGASAELCDREADCPFVRIPIIPTIDPAIIITETKATLISNQITSLEALDELTFAMQLRERQNRDVENEEANSEFEEELVQVLSMIKDAAADILGADVSRTLRAHGLRAVLSYYS